MDIEQVAEMEVEAEQTTPRGYSAYEVAKLQGYEGTEEEWLKSLVGPQGPKGEPGVIKRKFVNELPEVGSEDTIYMLPTEHPTEQNKFEEYMYSKENGWEHIGNTSVDLTDYYTKGDLLTCYVKSNIYLPGLSTGAKENINVNALTEIQNFINDNFGKIAKFAVVAPLSNLPTLFEPFETDGTNTFPILKNKPTSIILAGYYKKRHFGSGVSSDSLMSATMSLMQMVLTLSWVENTCTITAGYIRRATGTDNFVGVNYIESYFLEKNNNTPYTPSGPYNPATKKYVDDNKYTLPVASAETLGGIKLGEGLSADENGVVSASDSKNAIYSIEFSNVALSQYNTIYSSEFGSNKQTLLDFISNALNNSYLKNQTPVIFMNFKCSNYISNIPYFILDKADSNTILSPVASGSFYMLSDVKFVNNKYYYYRVEIQYTYENNIFTCTNITFNKTQRDMLDIYNALSKENTTSFTPTGDYNPSTKLYTDKTHYENMTGYDATKTQVLKNVNGTLTWVDEV